MTIGKTNGANGVSSNGAGGQDPGYRIIESKKDGKIRARMITPVGRATFLHLAAPDTGREYSNGKYHMTLLIPKATDIKPMYRAFVDVARQNFKDVDIKTVRSFIKNGDESKYPEFHDHYVIVLRGQEKDAPTLRARDRSITTADLFYPGCYARAEVTLYPYKSSRTVERESKNGKIEEVTRTVHGVSVGLEQVQFVKHGERFGGGGSTEFPDDLPEEDDHGLSAMSGTSLTQTPESGYTKNTEYSEEDIPF